MKMVAIGLSTAYPCGVRSYVEVMATALAAEGLETTTVWWDRDPAAPLRGDRAACRRWLADVEAQVAGAGADMVLWHYSVFSYSRRAVPILVPAVTRALRRMRVPVVTLLHEYEVTPWRLHG